MRGIRIAGVAAMAVALALLAAPTAGAVSMTLQGVTVKPAPGSSECCVLDGPTAWKYSAEGRTAEFNGTNGCLHNTWSFPIPTTIPEGGTKITLQVTARVSCSNSAPFVGVRGALVEGGKVEIFSPLADANNPSQSASGEVSLKPVDGTATLEVGVSDGPKWTYTFKADPRPTPRVVGCRRRTARAAANEVRVVAVASEVMFHRAGTPEDSWCAVGKDTVLQAGDEISCDPDGAATLQFADNSTVVVRNTTQLKIASFFTDGGTVRTEILLRMGEVAAKVRKSEATKSDFRFVYPAGVASVRGTTFRVNYDPGAKRGLVSVTEGLAAFTDLKGRETLVPAGKELMTTPAGAGTPVALGTAGRRAGVTPIAALARVMKIVARADEACGIELPIGNAYSTKPTRGGWKVTVEFVGKRRGKATWIVRRSKTTAAGKLAKAIGRRCRS